MAIGHCAAEFGAHFISDAFDLPHGLLEHSHGCGIFDFV
jgi:hypothetical protein